LIIVAAFIHKVFEGTSTRLTTVPGLKKILDYTNQNIPAPVLLENVGEQIAMALPLATAINILGPFLKIALEQSSQICIHAMVWSLGEI
jgi:hypothetical protein